MSHDVRLLISCPDRKDPISALSSSIATHDGSILSADQYASGVGDAEAVLRYAGWAVVVVRRSVEGRWGV